MAIQIGAKPESSFNDPLGLLSDCHRRIEKFLEQMVRIARDSDGTGLPDAERTALTTALKYFRGAAPLHTQDEERSLFPRLRVSQGSEMAAAFDALARLEADHDRADLLHAEVDALGEAWLTDGALQPADLGRLRAALQDLKSLYAAHIAVEDHEVFPLAGRSLAALLLEQVGREMAARRGLDFDNLPGVSHCQLRKAHRD